MVTGEVINSTDLLDVLLPLLGDRLGEIITLLQAIGVAFIAYVVYLIVMAVWRWKDRKRLRGVEEKVDIIGRKLDKILNTKIKKNKRK